MCPNVFWELGVRQSFKHCTITIAQTGTNLPFDISTKGTLFYEPHSYTQMNNFRTHLIKAVNHCINFPQETDSHVLETINGRGTLYEIIHKEETLRRIEAIIQELNWNQRAYRLSQLKDVFEDSEENNKFETYSADFPIKDIALKNLSINRYINTDANFYDEVDTIVLSIQLVKEKAIPLRNQSTTKSVSAYKKYLNTMFKDGSIFNNLCEKLIEIRDNLRNSA
ncbi:hypothetical protein [Dehalococcoides mccartyi]|uniref:hypothetical protein n=1 Tax=Dehalococcoides mccartyi TaxID=61435 RepID=UPI00128F4564|nr:hypothetical protein [Dehalococcoides mccartyi]